MKKWRRIVNLPPLHTAVPQWGNGFTQKLGLFFLVFFGWKFEGTLPDRNKVVAIGAPHTSNWDFPIAMAAIFALRIRFHWLGKHTFVEGFGKPLWRALGGIPVNRHQAGGMIGRVVAEFNAREQFWLGIAPEGTRKKVRQWKLGFYHIACAAGLPIMPIAFDYHRKVLRLGEPIATEGEQTTVFQRIAEFYKQNAVGKHPEKGAITLAEISGTSSVIH